MRAIDGGKTSETRGFRDVDGALCRAGGGARTVDHQPGSPSSALPRRPLICRLRRHLLPLGEKGGGAVATFVLSRRADPSSVGFADRR